MSESSTYTKAVSASTGSSEFEANTPNHVGIRFLDLAERSESSRATVEQIRKRIADIPRAKLTVALEAEGPPTGEPINLEIVSDSFAVLGEISKEIKKALAKLPHVKDIRDNFGCGRHLRPVHRHLPDAGGGADAVLPAGAEIAAGQEAVERKRLELYQALAVE